MSIPERQQHNATLPSPGDDLIGQYFHIPVPKLSEWSSKRAFRRLAHRERLAPTAAIHPNDLYRHFESMEARAVAGLTVSCAREMGMDDSAKNALSAKNFLPYINGPFLNHRSIFSPPQHFWLLHIQVSDQTLFFKCLSNVIS